MNDIVAATVSTKVLIIVQNRICCHFGIPSIFNSFNFQFSLSSSNGALISVGLVVVFLEPVLKAILGIPYYSIVLLISNL